MKGKFGVEQLILASAAIVGAVFAYLGLKVYGFWHPRRGPLPGFYPSLMGMILIVVSFAGFLKSFKDAPPTLERRNWYVVLAVVFVIAFSYVIGLLPSLASYILVWLIVVQKTAWKTVITTLLSISAIVYGVFILWLQVPFEAGIIYNSLWRSY